MRLIKSLSVFYFNLLYSLQLKIILVQFVESRATSPSRWKVEFAALVESSSSVVTTRTSEVVSVISVASEVISVSWISRIVASSSRRLHRLHYLRAQNVIECVGRDVSVFLEESNDFLEIGLEIFVGRFFKCFFDFLDGAFGEGLLVGHRVVDFEN